MTPLDTAHLTLRPNPPQHVPTPIGDPERSGPLFGLPAADPWHHEFLVVHRDGGAVIGTAGFKGPPYATGMVEIAYGIIPGFAGRGYATEAASALVVFAFDSERVMVIWAHTLPESNASTRVLIKCGFDHVGAIVDPEDGLVWRWERRRVASGCRQAGSFALAQQPVRLYNPQAYVERVCGPSTTEYER